MYAKTNEYLNPISFAEFLEIFCILTRFLSTFYDFDVKFRGRVCDTAMCNILSRAIIM